MNYFHSYVLSEKTTKNNIFSEKNKLFLYSLVCSVFSSIKNKDNIDLYCNDYAKEIFIDDLNLPYNKIYSLKTNDNFLFVLPKIESNCLQNKKFCHIDSDFFMTKKLNLDCNEDFIFLTSYVISKERSKKYLNYWVRLMKYTSNIPEFIKNINFNKVIKNYNMSMLYCNNIDIIYDYFCSIKNYIEENKKTIETLNIEPEPYFDMYFRENINEFLEEFLFSQFLTQNNINTRELTTDEKKSIVHLGHCKKDYCKENEKLIKYTKNNYLDYYELINEYIQIWKNLNL